MWRWCVMVFLAAGSAHASDQYPESLQLHRFEVCRDQRRHCEAWLLAHGKMAPSDPRRLVDALKAGPVRGVAFDSPGGNLFAGMAIGRIIRQQGLDTWAGAPNPATRYIRGGRSVCLSACSYAFLGGVERYGSPEPRIGIHRFVRGDKKLSTVLAHLPASLTDAPLELLLGMYVREMGISSSMVDAAQKVANTTLHLVTDVEARQWRVFTRRLVLGEVPGAR